ncbi:MAG: RdgB/HAM1 family non-canonical purine NTP pyrophosphatase [Acidaminococcaceae bacterium]|nr:RdgB/HAM1 family non-canonical purine NTP pyrophosphatase [Acidaminococcaceae bacterium]
METLVIATSNLGKLDEFKEMFKDVPVTLKCLADYPQMVPPNENGRTFAANAKIKATYYARNLKEYCLADDSGLEVKALDGAPGVRSARFAGEEATDKENNDLLLQQMKFQITRSCRFRCALAVANPNGKIVGEADGSCEGMLLHEPLGDNGFGYDPLFWSTELHKGLGEATADEKNKISHRGKAVKKLISNWKKIK